MNVELASGEVKWFRLIRGIIRGGFVLSPLVESSQDFSALYSKPDAVSRPKRIQLEEQTFGGAAQFDPQIALHFSRLTIEQR
jgi:hypothetical protein